MKKIYLGLIVVCMFFLTGCALNSSEKKEDQKKEEVKIEDDRKEEPKTSDICSYDTPEKCDNSCNGDAECQPFTPKFCININEKNEGDDAVSFYSLPDCQCENKKCVVVE